MQRQNQGQMHQLFGFCIERTRRMDRLEVFFKIRMRSEVSSFNVRQDYPPLAQNYRDV